MVEEIRDTNRTFSYEELDVINKFVEKNNAFIDINELNLITVESDSVCVSFKFTRYENKRRITVCIREFDNYNCHSTYNPADIKRVLEL